MLSCVYAIVINGKNYIGSTKDFETRTNKHFSDLAGSKHSNAKMQKDYNKFKDFKRIILIEMDSNKDLTNHENFYIGLYNSIENGYNKKLASRTFNTRKGYNELIKSLKSTLSIAYELETLDK